MNQEKNQFICQGTRVQLEKVDISSINTTSTELIPQVKSGIRRRVWGNNIWTIWCMWGNRFQKWPAANNFCLNPSKFAEIVCTKTRLNPSINISLPQPFLGIPKFNSLKILRVMINDKQSISNHVIICTGIGRCAQSLYTPTMLTANGLNIWSIQTIFKSRYHYAQRFVGVPCLVCFHHKTKHNFFWISKKSSESAFAPYDKLSFSLLSEWRFKGTLAQRWLCSDTKIWVMGVFLNTIFVSSLMYPENLKGTQIIVGSMNMGYISNTARNDDGMMLPV